MLFDWLGSKINRKVFQKIEDLQEQVQEMWINSHRKSILTFARETRAGIEHSTDEWTNVLNAMAEYEAFCHSHNIVNGVIRAEIDYLRDLYQELSREHRIL